jgi:hypothetical protein
MQDLRRTFPESRHFSSDSALGLQNLEKLERVLTAFSRRSASGPSSLLGAAQVATSHRLSTQECGHRV